MGGIGNCCVIETCRYPGCDADLVLPDGSKTVAFSSSSYNPLSQSSSASFARNTVIGSCCSQAVIAGTANYLSPVYDGVEFFSDEGDFPVYQCCGTTGTTIGTRTAKLQLAESFAYRFRLRLCSVTVSVCQKIYDSVCGIEIRVKAIMARKTNGNLTQECQSKVRDNISAYTPCGSYTITPASDTTVFRRNCCCTSIFGTCGVVAVDPHPLDFVSQPTPPTVTAPAEFDCNYSNGFDGSYFSNNGAEYFSIERVAFLPGQTAVPTTPISFPPNGLYLSGGQTLVSAPSVWLSSVAAYAAFSQSVSFANACGQQLCGYSNFGAGLFPSCSPGFAGGCWYNYIRTLNQPRSLVVGTHFFDPMNDTWSVTIS